MANIIINNRCNLKCQYCFAEEKIMDEVQNISMEQLDNIMNFIHISNDPRIGIIGGEPLLHPDIEEILAKVNRFTRDNNMKSVLFTNGIHLEKYIPFIGERMSALININHPDTMTEQELAKFTNMMEHMYDLDWFGSKRISIGVNIYHELDDYQFIYDIIELYEIKRVRVSFVAPTYNDHHKDKEEYFTKAVPKFVEFCTHMFELECKIGLDCSWIPTCYYNEDELEIVESVLDRDISADPIDHLCNPVCDITSDYKVIPCFGVYEEIDIRRFSNLNEVMGYIILKKYHPLIEKNVDNDKCRDCSKAEYSQCQGGCLAFAKLNQS